jgi:hypothetical protein
MIRSGAPAHLFLLGEDYHLGDLLWLTAVLAEYRRQLTPSYLMVGCPDQPISRILEQNPLIDELLYGEAAPTLASARARFGALLVVRDLRPVALARAMLRDCRYRLPWLYYRDLWFSPRGQWLATFLRLGELCSVRPRIALCDGDRTAARALPSPYVALAPHIGRYGSALATRFWRRLKGWPAENWAAVAALVRGSGYEPVTLAAADQRPIAGTRPLLGLPIRQAAGVIEGAHALISGESGLWFVAAACGTPFMIVPWWLPRSMDWAAPMGVAHRLVYRNDASAAEVYAGFEELVSDGRLRT